MTEDANQDQKTEKQILMDRCRLMGISFSNNSTVESLRAKIDAKLAGEQPPTNDGDDNDADEDEQIDEDGDGHDDRNGQFVDGNQAAVDGDDDQAEVEQASEPEAPAAPAPAPTPTPAPIPHPLASTTESGEVPPAPAPGRKMTKLERENALRHQLKRDKMALVRVRITNLNPAKKDLPGEIFTVANKYLGTVRKYVPYGEVTDNGYHIPVCIYEQLEDRRFQNIRTVKDRRTGVNRVETNWAKEFAIEILPQLTREELDRLANAQAAAGSIDR
jgi:hypothetical protein